MTGELRNKRRVAILLDVLLEAATGRYEARTSDLSMDGCFIDAAGQVAVGDTIRFKLRLPAGDWMELQGEVVYAHANTGFGVRFTNVSDSDRQRLGWLVDAEAYRAKKQEEKNPGRY